MLGCGIEFDADLRDRIPLHVAHDEFDGPEAQAVPDSWYSAEPTCQKFCDSFTAFHRRCRIIKMSDRSEPCRSVEGEFTEEPPIIGAAALGARAEYTVEQRKIPRACQREYIVAKGEGRGGCGAAGNSIPNDDQNARCGRERQRFHGFGYRP